MRMEAKQFGARTAPVASAIGQAAEAHQNQQQQQGNQAEMIAADLGTMRNNDNDRSFVQQDEREQRHRNEQDEEGRRLREWSLMQIVESAESKLMRQKVRQQRQQSLRMRPSKLLLKSAAFAKNTLDEDELNKLASSSTATAAAQNDYCCSTYSGCNESGLSCDPQQAQGSKGSSDKPIGPAQMAPIQSGQFASPHQQQRQQSRVVAGPTTTRTATTTTTCSEAPDCSRKPASSALVAAENRRQQQQGRLASMTNRRGCLNEAAESGDKQRQDYMSAGGDGGQRGPTAHDGNEEARSAHHASGHSRESQAAGYLDAAAGRVDLHSNVTRRRTGSQRPANDTSDDGGQDERGGPTPTNDLIRALIHKDRLALKSDLAPTMADEPAATAKDASALIRGQQPDKQALCARRNKTDGLAATASNLTVGTTTGSTAGSASGKATGPSQTLDDDARRDQQQPSGGGDGGGSDSNSNSSSSGCSRRTAVTTIATRLKLSPASRSSSPPSSAGSSASPSSSPSATSSSASSSAAFSAALLKLPSTGAHDNPDKCPSVYSHSRQPATATGAAGTEEQSIPQRKRSMFDLSGLISKCQHLQVSPEASGAGGGADSSSEVVVLGGEQCRLSPYLRAAQALAKSISSRKPSDPTAMVSPSKAAELPAVVALQQQRRHSTYLLPTLLINKGPFYLSDDSSSPSEDKADVDVEVDADVELEEIERLALDEDSDYNNGNACEFNQDNSDDDRADDMIKLIGLPKLLGQSSRPTTTRKTSARTRTSATCKVDNSAGSQSSHTLMEFARETTVPRRRVATDSDCTRNGDKDGDDETNRGGKLSNSASSPSALSTPTNDWGGCGGPCCSQQTQLIKLAAENASLTGHQSLSLREPAALIKRGTCSSAPRKLSLFSLSSAATGLVAAAQPKPAAGHEATSSVDGFHRKGCELAPLALASLQLQSAADQHRQKARCKRMGSNPLDRLRLNGGSGSEVANRRQQQQRQQSAAANKHQLSATSNSGRLALTNKQLAGSALSMSACLAGQQPAKPHRKRHSLVNMLISSGSSNQQHFASTHHLVSRLAHPRSLFPGGGGQHQQSCSSQNCYCKNSQDGGRRRKTRASLEGGSISVGLSGAGTGLAEHYEPLIPERGFKIVVMGTSGSGKTSIIQRFMYDSFDSRHLPTVEDTYFIEFPYLKNIINISISDTSGTYQFPAMKRLAINSGDAFILVYSVDNPKSFNDLEELRQTILEERERAYMEASASLISNESNSSGLFSSIGSSQSSCASSSIASHQQLQQSHHHHHPQQLGHQQPAHNHLQHHSLQQQLLQQPADPNNNRDLSPSRQWSLASLFNHQAPHAAAPPGGGGGQLKGIASCSAVTTNSVCSSVCSSSCSSADNSRRSSISAAEAALKTRRTRRPPMVIVANKYDIPEDKHLVNSDEIEALAVIDWNNGFVRASAAINLNINEIFQQVLKQAKQPPTLTEAIISKRRKSLPPKLPHSLTSHASISFLE